MEKFFFLIFALVAVISALAVISFRNPVHSALALIACLLQVAGIFILLRSPFLAVLQVFIYLGGVMVLFLFVVMILDIKKAKMGALAPANKWLMCVITSLIAVEFLVVIMGGSLSGFPLRGGGKETTIQAIGDALFTEYLFPFELVSILFLFAMAGSFVMAKKRWD